MNRDQLIAQIIDCERCELHAQCTLPVPFFGEPGRILVLGEAPGEQEDKAGRPFIGPAGELFRSLLGQAGINPDTLSYANTVCCFPHGTPTWDHVRSCSGHKFNQIDYLNPTYILLLGKVALRSMRPDLDLNAHGRPFVHNRICFASYHPSAALRNAKYERVLKRDLATFAKLIRAERWDDLIPDDCSRCDDDAVVWESCGLGWCPNHVPEAMRSSYDARMQRQVDELDAARRRDQALTQVADAADPDWMTAAWNALVEYLYTHETFFVDDFWLETSLQRPKESRALGPVVLRAARQGLMKKSGEFRKSTASNLTEKPCWSSLIYRKP